MVARLSYDATEQDLESEFGRFGPIERVCLLGVYLLFLLTRSKIRIVVDTKQDEKPNKKKKKHRGYAFVVYEREKDMRGNAITTPRAPLTPLCRTWMCGTLVQIWPSSCLSHLL